MKSYLQYAVTHEAHDYKRIYALGMLAGTVFSTHQSGH